MPSADDLAERQAINKIGSNDVYVRAAKLSDATALIKLNEEFRENMLRWQQEDDDAEYPALDFDDVEFILKEEDEQNLIVLCEKPAGGRRQTRIIGYSYAYDEPWAASDDSKEGKGKGKGKGKEGKGKEGETKQSDHNNSLYIAEVLRPALAPAGACGRPALKSAWVLERTGAWRKAKRPWCGCAAAALPSSAVAWLVSRCLWPSLSGAAASGTSCSSRRSTGAAKPFRVHTCTCRAETRLRLPSTTSLVSSRAASHPATSRTIWCVRWRALLGPSRFPSPALYFLSHACGVGSRLTANTARQVLEMPNTKKCVAEAAKRLKDKFNYGQSLLHPRAH